MEVSLSGTSPFALKTLELMLNTTINNHLELFFHKKIVKALHGLYDFLYSKVGL